MSKTTRWKIPRGVALPARGEALPARGEALSGAMIAPECCEAHRVAVHAHDIIHAVSLSPDPPPEGPPPLKATASGLMPLTARPYGRGGDAVF